MIDDYKILLGAILDAKAKVDLKKQLESMKDLSATVSKLNLEPAAIKHIKEQLSNNGIDINLVFGNTKQLQSQAKQTGQQIGQIISDSAQQAINSVSSNGKYLKIDSSTSKNFQNEMSKLVDEWTNGLGKLTDVKISTRTSYNKDTEQNITKLHQAQVTYNNEINETIQKTIAWQKIGTDMTGNDLMGFVEVAGQYSKSLDKASSQTDRFVEKQKKSIASLQTSLSSIQAKYQDPNISKPIKSQSNLDALENQYNVVQQAIKGMGDADRVTFSDMEIQAKAQISVLESMVREYRNAENVATSLRTKDIGTVKQIEVQNLEKFKNELSGSNVPIERMKTDLDSLDGLINKAFDANSLTEYLNQLDIVKAKYKQISAEITASNKNERVGINVSGLEAKIADVQRISEGEINNFSTKINNADVSVESLLRDLSKVNSAGDFSVVNAKLNSFIDSAKAAGIAVSEIAANSNKLSSIQLGIDTEKYSTEIFKLQQQLANFGVQSGEAFNKASTSLNLVNDAYTKMASASGDERIKYEKEYQTHLATTKNLLTQIKSVKSNELIQSGDMRRGKLITNLNNYLAKNTALTKESKQRVNEWIATLESVDDMTKGDFDNLRLEFERLDASMRQSGKLGLSLRDKLGQAWEKFGGWSIATGSFMLAVNQIRKIPQEVYKINTAMTNLYKVTDETSAKYDQFLSSATKSAQELGRSVSSLVEQTATWAKLGFSIDDSAKLAEYSSIYANVGEVDDGTAVADIITALKSFNIETSDSIQIVDKFNKLGNEFATDAAGLGEGLKNSASALSLAGNDINQSLAMITGMTELTQNASESGNAIKILSMRLRAMKGELEELGEDTQGIESISKIQTQLLNLSKNAVNIFDDQGNFKSTYEIMSDIANVWDHISQTDQAQMLEIIAGKQRGNSIAALIKSFQSGQVDNALSAALNSEGSAMQEQKKWMDSIHAKLQQLEAAFQSLSNTVLDSDFLKNLVDMGTSLVNTLDSIIERFGAFPSVMAGLAGIIGTKNIGRANYSCPNEYADIHVCFLYKV